MRNYLELLSKTSVNEDFSHSELVSETPCVKLSSRWLTHVAIDLALRQIPNTACE